MHQSHHPDAAEFGQHVANGGFTGHSAKVNLPQPDNTYNTLGEACHAARLGLWTLPGDDRLSHHV